MYLQEHIEGRAYDVGVDIHRIRDDHHESDHHNCSPGNTELVLLIGLVVKDMGQEHSRQRQPKHEISIFLKKYMEMFFPAND